VENAIARFKMGDAGYQKNRYPQVVYGFLPRLFLVRFEEKAISR